MQFFFQSFKIIFKAAIPMFKFEMWFFFATLAFKKNYFDYQGQACKEKDCYSCMIK